MNKYTFYTTKNNISIEFKQEPLKNAIKLIMELENSHLFYKFHIETPDGPGVCYFNNSLALALIADEITSDEYIQACICENLYRNKQDLAIISAGTIDAGSLFFKKGDYLYLVDDDQPLKLEFESDLFYKV